MNGLGDTEQKRSHCTSFYLASIYKKFPVTFNMTFLYYFSFAHFIITRLSMKKKKNSGHKKLFIYSLFICHYSLILKKISQYFKF